MDLDQPGHTLRLMTRDGAGEPRHHCVISGTGRAGTSFLVQILTHLGVDTGFTVDRLALHTHARAGLEADVRQPGAPYVVKSPWFCDYAREVFERDDIVIDRILIPMRDLTAAAESRRFVVRSYAAELSREEKESLRASSVAGGLWLTEDPDEQESVLLDQLYRLLLEASGEHIPITLLRYPLLVRDPEYLIEKLRPLLGGVSPDEFKIVFDEVVRPEWIHKFGDNDT